MTAFWDGFTYVLSGPFFMVFSLFDEQHEPQKPLNPMLLQHKKIFESAVARSKRERA